MLPFFKGLIILLIWLFGIRPVFSIGFWTPILKWNNTIFLIGVVSQRTGSMVKLQKVMGHSSLNVSLTYLRGLEVAELTEEDMPKV